MKKVIFILIFNLFAILLSKAQIVNKFRDSSQFTKGVRFDSTLHFAGLKVAGTADSVVLISDLNGTVKKINKSILLNGVGISQGTLNDSILAVRNIRKVDTLYKNLDSVIFKINGIRYGLKDSVNIIPALTFTKNTAKDSIILSYNGSRLAVKDSIGSTAGLATQSALNDTATALRSIRKMDTLYRNVDSLVFKINGLRYSVKDSINSTNGFVPYTGATQDVDLGAWALNAASVKINGTNGSGHIHLRHQASNATAQGQTSTIFADNNGDLKWKNDGLSYSTFKTSGITADRVFRFPDSTGTVALLTNIPTIPAFTFSKNAGRDSIIATYNGTRSAVKDSIGSGAGSVALSAIVAATANNTISNAAYNQEWQWTNPTGTGLKLSTASTSAVNNSVLFEISSTGANSNVTTYGQKITANRTGTNVVNYGLDITHAGTNGAGLNISTNGVGINLAASMTGGIQMNSNKLAFDASSVGTIQYASSILQIASNASRTFFINTGTSNSWNFASSTTANYVTLNRLANGSYGLVFNGDYASGSYRSELTSNNVIKANGGSLTLCANTGVSNNFANFTPTDILTVYGTNTNVGIGTTTPASTSILELSSTSKGLLPPRMTNTQKNNIVSPATGLTIYCTDCTATDASTGVMQTYNGTTWKNYW
jgi:hypothetical protein